MTDQGSTHRHDLLLQKVSHGVELCRGGDWEAGLEQLSRADELGGSLEPLPGVAESYLGYGIAAHRGEYEEGLRRCREAVEREIWVAETHLNLARTYLLRRDKRRAIPVLDQGLDLDPRQAQLLSLRQRLGYRRKLFFPFLQRGQILNRVMGRFLHSLKSRTVFRRAKPASQHR